MQPGGLDPSDADSVLAAYAPGVLEAVDAAPDLDGLAEADAAHDGLVRVLAQVGLPVPAIGRAVALLNHRVMARLYALAMPPELVARTCLMVMGSEGRGEQVLKTDQDNGLIVRDGVDPLSLAGPLKEFSDGLARLGWPPCPGNVMVTNRAWVRDESGWAETLGRWVRLPNPDSFMAVAIFADAGPVAGDAALLDGARRRLLDLLAGHGAFLSQFAHTALTFETPLGLFGTLLTEGGEHKGRLDLKKGGIFPIVHGVRALALEAHLPQTNTLDRLAALMQADRLERGLAVDLREAFEFLLALRLKAKLHEARQDGADNLVTPAQLAPDEREELRHAFRVVKQFKDLLSYHFHLGMF